MPSQEKKEERSQELEDKQARRCIWVINSAGLTAILVGLMMGCHNAVVIGLSLAIITAAIFPLFL